MSPEEEKNLNNPNKENAEQPENNQVDNADDPSIPRLRTYKHDIKTAVENKDLTSTRILLEEQRKRAEYQASEESASIKSPKNKILLIISLLLILGAGGFLGFIWFFPKIAPQEDSRILIERPNFIEVNGQTLIPVELRNPRDIFSDVARLIVRSLPQDTIEELLLARSKTAVVENQEVTIPETITTTELFNLLETREPPAILRALGSQYMLGLYGDRSIEPFLLFKINDFENTFASMLAWESVLTRDVQPIFFSQIRREELSKPQLQTTRQVQVETSTTTEEGEIATSTETRTITIDPTLNFNPLVFRDMVIKNTDARAITDNLGEIVFFYTFINNDHLFISTSPEALEEVTRRLRQARLIR